MIGIFDSGTGGLTIARALADHLPGYDIVYFGDTARTPYGNRSPEAVIRYTLRNIHFLLDKGAKIIVMACNTASSFADEHITKRFDIPIFEVITPAVALSLNVSKTFRIGVIGTRATVNSGIYEKKIREINPDAKIYSAACPLLVPLVEECWTDKPEIRMIVKKYLYPLKVRQIDTLILGCTHYPILKKIIQRKIGKRVNLIDSSLAVSETVKDFLEKHPEVDNSLGKEGKAEFFVSDVTEHLENTARIIFKRNIALRLIRI